MLKLIEGDPYLCRKEINKLFNKIVFTNQCEIDVIKKYLENTSKLITNNVLFIDPVQDIYYDILKSNKNIIIWLSQNSSDFRQTFFKEIKKNHTYINFKPKRIFEDNLINPPLITIKAEINGEKKQLEVIDYNSLESFQEYKCSLNSVNYNVFTFIEYYVFKTIKEINLNYFLDCEFEEFFNVLRNQIYLFINIKSDINTSISPNYLSYLRIKLNNIKIEKLVQLLNESEEALESFRQHKISSISWNSFFIKIHQERNDFNCWMN